MTSSVTVGPLPSPEAKSPDSTSPGGCPPWTSSIGFVELPVVLGVEEPDSWVEKGSNSARIEASTRARGEAADEVGLSCPEGFLGVKSVESSLVPEPKRSRVSQVPTLFYIELLGNSP
jgi:hypothetical protein